MYLKCFINCDIILIFFPILTKIADTTESSSFFEVFLPFSKCFWKHFKMFSIIDTYFFAYFDVTNSKDLQVSLVSNRFCVRSARMVKSSWIWTKGLSLDLNKWILNSQVSNRKVYPLINFQEIFHPTRCDLSLPVFSPTWKIFHPTCCY